MPNKTIIGFKTSRIQKLLLDLPFIKYGAFNIFSEMEIK